MLYPVESANQWIATTFRQHLNRSIELNTRTIPDLSSDDRLSVELMVLGIWLDAAVPAGNG